MAVGKRGTLPIYCANVRTIPRIVDMLNSTLLFEARNVVNWARRETGERPRYKHLFVCNFPLVLLSCHIELGHDGRSIEQCARHRHDAKFVVRDDTGGRLDRSRPFLPEGILVVPDASKRGDGGRATMHCDEPTGDEAPGNVATNSRRVRVQLRQDNISPSRTLAGDTHQQRADPAQSR